MEFWYIWCFLVLFFILLGALSKPKTNKNIHGLDLEPKGYMIDSPVSFNHFVGQKKAIKLLQTHVLASKINGNVVPHILLEGPGGTGKTTIAMCIANEIGASYKVTTPSTLKDKNAVLNFFFDVKNNYEPKFEEGDVLFIDEIHRVRESAAIYLYSIMQDFYMDAGDGTILEVPKITFVGATTELGMLPGPFRDRFKIRVVLDTYDKESITEIVTKYRKIDNDVADLIAYRSCGIPRIAKAITDSVIAVATVENKEIVDKSSVEEACSLLEIDGSGLNKNARRVIAYFQNNNNTPCGIMSLAHSLNISKETIEHEIFPVLFHLALLTSKGTRGKCLTEKGMNYNASL